MRSWGISSPPDLSRWFQDQGFAMTQPRNHIPARIRDRGGVQVRCSSGIVGSVFRSCDIACGPTNGRPTRFRPVGVTRWVEVGTVGRSRIERCCVECRC